MENNNNIDSTQNEGENSTASLYLSLYLVLLAFFILLNSLSQKDKVKEALAISSISKSFSKHDGLTDDRLKLPEIFDYAYLINDYFSTIEGTVKSIYQFQDVQISRKGNRMETVIPISRFFSEDNTEIKRKQKEFLDKLSKIITTQKKGIRVNFDLSIDASPYLNVNNQEAVKAEMDRYELVVKHLISRGVPPDAIIGGIKFNDTRNVTIRFTVYEDGYVRD